MNEHYVVRYDRVGVRHRIADAIIYFGLVSRWRDWVDGCQQLVLVGREAVRVQSHRFQRLRYIV